MMRRAFALLAFLALGLTTLTALADPPGLKPLAIGSPAPDFRLPGVDGKTHGLHEYDASKVLVIAFTCNHCPTANAYEARFKKFADDYKAKGVAFVAISPNDPKAVRLDELSFTDLDDSFEAMKIRAKDHAFNFPYLYDGETQATSRAFGVLATPHLFIFDADRKLRYQGRFDDSEVKEVKSHDAIKAVEAILSGSKVAIETTRVPGCSTKWADKQESARQWLAKADAEPVSLEEIDASGVAKLVKNDTKNLLLVNLWATWCGPCVAELPELVEMNRMYRSRAFRLATISLDEPAKRDAALEMLRKNHVSAANYLSKVDGQDKLAEALDKEWPGPVPYTLIVAPGGKVIYRKSGAIEPLEVKRAIVGYLGSTY
jgi:peroxiredoxin